MSPLKQIHIPWLFAEMDHTWDSASWTSFGNPFTDPESIDRKT